MANRVTKMNTQAIAQHLNLAKELIVEVQEWAKVLWVRIKGMRPRFVSKKIMQPTVVKIKPTHFSSEELVVLLSDNSLWMVRTWGLTRSVREMGIKQVSDRQRQYGGNPQGWDYSNPLIGEKKWNEVVAQAVVSFKG